jgi:hypothetical protein
MTMALQPGDWCIQPNADWTAVDSLVVEKLEPTKVILHAAMRNGSFSDTRLTLARDAPLFKNPYRPGGAIPREARTIRKAACIGSTLPQASQG